MRSRNWWLRLVAPPALVVAAISSIALATGASAGGSPALPPKPADQLLTMLRNAQQVSVHGTVVEQAGLGLPDLPASIGGDTTTGLLGLTSGKHTMRVWEGGHARFRVQILDQLDETELVSNGHAFWTYTYSTDKADELRLPDSTSESIAVAPTPGQAAANFLAVIGKSTNVTTLTTARVAGRDAYTLDIEPLTSATTIGRISIDVDAVTGVPLRVRVYAAAANSAAFSIGFTSISFGSIDASLFDFTPPPNAKVSVATPSSDAASSQLGNGIYLAGSGWATIVVVPHMTRETLVGRDSLTGMFDKMGQRVDGGTLLPTTLVNALLTPDGRLLVGAVPASALQAAASAAAAAAVAPTR
ncbi:MAG: LolA family protein [Acidothermaceae bacterium]